MKPRFLQFAGALVGLLLSSLAVAAGDGVVIYRCDTCHAPIEAYGYAVGGKHYCANCQFAAHPDATVCPFPYRCVRCGIPLPVPGYCELCWHIVTDTDASGYVIRACPECHRQFRDYDPPTPTPLCPICRTIPFDDRRY